mgnify:CR=1 FL=1|jgi:hypothetical protein
MLIRMRHGRRRLRILLPGVLLAAALTAQGCGGADRAGPQGYGNDGYMGLTRSNPHLPITGTAWSYRRDNAFVAELLSGLKGIRHIRVTRTGGSHMRVHLDIDQSLSPEEAERLAARAEAILRENFPRYRVTVSADRD